MQEFVVILSGNPCTFSGWHFLSVPLPLRTGNHFYAALWGVSLQVSPLLVSPLLVVPTDRTNHTEAYGIKVSESTERIEAARHTTEGTELIACVASPRLSMVAVYGGARLLYLYLLCLYTDQQAFISVDSCIAKRRPFCGFEKLKPVGFCFLC